MIMRMWLIDPRLLCNQHLMGEHCEMHMFVGTINAGKNIDGYIDTGLLNISFLQQRHDELANEMIQRNMNHKSPLQKIVEKNELNKIGFVDRKHSINELYRRCSKCRKRIESSIEFFRS